MRVKALSLRIGLLLALAVVGVADPGENLKLPITGGSDPGYSDVPVHDPVMIRYDGTYYLFATGRGIAVWSSHDRVKWVQEAPVFAEPPAWAVAAVPGFKGHIWAPDISHHAGRYYLYYSVSAFGKNTSCIGVATNVTLDPRDPRFRWEDHGKVIESVPGQTNWNAIDPNLVESADGTAWLAFGSFWEGLKLAKLAPDRLQPAETPDHWPTLASRELTELPAPPPGSGYPTNAGDNAIEAPFIFRHDDRYYLFASIDYCCRGKDSTYKMIVGRAENIAGPYLDRDGNPLAHGGGTILLAGDARWHGVGHNAVCSFDGVDYLVFHGYDATDPAGKAKLRILPIEWDDAGWPIVQSR